MDIRSKIAGLIKPKSPPVEEVIKRMTGLRYRDPSKFNRIWDKFVARKPSPAQALEVLFGLFPEIGDDPGAEAEYIAKCQTLDQVSRLKSTLLTKAQSAAFADRTIRMRADRGTDPYANSTLDENASVKRKISFILRD